MARLDIHRNLGRGREFPLLLDVQSDLLDPLPTRLVIPLARRTVDRPPHRRLNPCFTIDGVDHVLHTELMGSVNRRQLGAVVGSLDDRHHEIIAAIDFLLQGF